MALLELVAKPPSIKAGSNRQANPNRIKADGNRIKTDDGCALTPFSERVEKT